MSVRKSVALAIAVAGMGGTSQSSPALAQSANWSGPYVGIEGGGGWGHQSQSGGGPLVLPSGGGVTHTIITVGVVSDGNYGLSGGLLGGTIGYNFQSRRVVYGVEGDASWADFRGSGTCGVGGFQTGCGGDIRGLETIRGRFGYDIGPFIPSLGNVLPFVSGGWAFGRIHAWDALLGTSGDKSMVGWTLGGGLEAMLGSNWSVRAEYLHVDFGNRTVFSAIPPNPENVSTTAEVFRLALDYHFNWTGPAPQGRRYP